MVLALSAQQISSISWAATLSLKADRQLGDIFFTIFKKFEIFLRLAQQKQFKGMLLNMMYSRAANAGKMILANSAKSIG